MLRACGTRYINLAIICNGWSKWPDFLAPFLKPEFRTTLFSKTIDFDQPLPWFLTRICMAKGGRGCLRPSYSRPKKTLFQNFFWPNWLVQIRGIDWGTKKEKTGMSKLSDDKDIVAFYLIHYSCLSWKIWWYQKM